MSKRHYKKIVVNGILLLISMGLLAVSGLAISFATAKIPDFKSFEERKIARSTKIYDRTGKILLYNIHEDIKRTTVPFNEMGVYIKNAVVAIEDSEFYQHKGVRPKAIIRALWFNLSRGEFSQGGSTITQQIIKNTLLTSEKTIIRKLKEWVLSIKLEQVVGKEEILALYLNESPYGGNIYGIQEASTSFFGKESSELTLAEAAYLAAIPKAPTYYSPYGENKYKLDNRKNIVLRRMKDLAFISEEEYEDSRNEVVEFLPREKFGIRAPHFVFFVREYLERKYGKDTVEQGGLKIITTLDYEFQEKAEEIVLRHALQNEEDWNASNASLVAIDPKTGHILVMVGSRNYFDKEIDGNFNIAVAKRQPGSSFKPFVYATAFKERYTPNTVVFDLPTEFQSTCDYKGNTLPGYNQDDCYSPRNFNNKFKGPVTLREALGQSINVASVKVLYLAGVADSLKTAKDMGIKTLTDPNRYGLTLVLGGGEVRLLDMVSAYGVFATGGIRHPYKSILQVEDAFGNILEEYRDEPGRVLDKNSALLVSDILSDNVARTPLFGANSFIYFGEDKDVAGKTGTTNDNRDAWMLGYTPNIVVGVWSGNNDNTPMKKGSSISGRLWRDFMDVALQKLPDEKFEEPIIDNDRALANIIRGIWQGGETYLIDSLSGKLATQYTPPETEEELVVTSVHSILYWINKENPIGEAPLDPTVDNQFERWEIIVQEWWGKNKHTFSLVAEEDIPTEVDDIHTPETQPVVVIKEPNGDKIYNQNQQITLVIDSTSHYPLKKIDVFVNNIYLGSVKNSPFTFSFTPSDVNNLQNTNELKVIARDSVFNSTQATVQFIVAL